MKIACEKHGVYELNFLNKNIQSIPKNKANSIIDNVYRAYKYEYLKSKQIWQENNNKSSRSSGWKPDKDFYYKLVSNSKIDESIEVEDIEKILKEMIMAIRKEKSLDLEPFVNLHNTRQDSEDNRLDTLQASILIHKLNKIEKNKNVIEEAITKYKVIDQNLNYSFLEIT